MVLKLMVVTSLLMKVVRNKKAVAAVASRKEASAAAAAAVTKAAAAAVAATKVRVAAAAVTTAIVVDTITIINNNDIDEALKSGSEEPDFFYTPHYSAFLTPPAPLTCWLITGLPLYFISAAPDTLTSSLTLANTCASPAPDNFTLTFSANSS